jgi:hypothetical protein
MTLIAGTGSAFASTHSDFTESFHLQTLKTFEFKDQRRISRDPLANNDIWANDVKDAIRRDLTEHGYVEAVNGHPDFYVAFYVGLKDRYDVNAIGYGLPVFHRRGWWGWPGGYDAWAVPYTQSTLIVDVIDARTNQLVWRGYDTDTLNDGKPAKTLDAAVDHVVSRLVHDEKKHA